jgi:hypothetical protein
MDYSEIQIKILLITNRLNSIVSVDAHDYTHQPEKGQIVNRIEECIDELNLLITCELQ